MAAVVEAATKTAAAMATTCCRDWNRARRNLKLPTFPSPLTDADGRGDPRGEIVSPVKKKTPAIHPKPDPAEATPRSVGRLRRGFAGRRAARHSTAVRRRPCRCLSALPASADGLTDGRQKIITRFSAPRRIIGLREAALSTHPSAPPNAFHLRGIICYVIYRQ